MIYRRFRIQVTLRILTIIATSLLLAYVLGWTRRYEAALILFLAIAYQISALIRYEEKTTRDLTRFLEAIRFSDFSVGFTGGSRGPIFDALRKEFNEVTEAFRKVRAEREEHFRYLHHVIHHVGVALISFREDGAVQFINAAARRLLGISHLRHVTDLDRFSPVLTQTLLRPESRAQNLIRVDRDGRVLQLSVNSSRFPLGDETFTLASIQDIGNELEQKEMEAWQKLTRVLTHEIMNSVAPISSLAATADQLIGKDLSSDGGMPSSIRDVQEAVRIIERRSEALMHFVDAYRSFTRLPTPVFEMIAARELLHRVRRLLNTELETKGITCEIHIDPEGLILTADPELVEQVLINLLLNAAEAVEGRSGAQIVLRAQADERGVPMVQVCDNGDGIPLDLQDQIFVPFFTTKENGSGIGLSLSRQIMRLHGGTLSLRSEAGQGAVFTLRF